MKIEATFVQYFNYSHKILTYNYNVAIIGLKQDMKRGKVIFSIWGIAQRWAMKR